MLCVDVPSQIDSSDLLPDRDGLRSDCKGHNDSSGDRFYDNLVWNYCLYMRDNV